MFTKRTVEGKEAFGALAHEHRLQIYRFLMQKYPEGASSGDIAESLGLPASTMSNHLRRLERAYLLKSWCVERNVFYVIDTAGSRGLVSFLAEDYLRGHPEICASILNESNPSMVPHQMDTPMSGTIG
ncbi:MAG: ArsR/SmtB family transcription factor [Methyloligellaceae bacterium]